MRTRAASYRETFERGRDKADAMMFNGEYYVQVLDDIDRINTSLGQGASPTSFWASF